MRPHGIDIPNDKSVATRLPDELLPAMIGEKGGGIVCKTRP